MKISLELFFKGLVNEVDFKLTCPDQIIKAAEELGATVDTDTLETNGWQWDYWMYGKQNEKRFCISGSGFYGNGRISWQEEDED